MSRVLLFLFFFLATTSLSSARQIAEITGYFMDWDSLTRSTQNPSDVRRHPDAVFHLIKSTAITTFLDLLKLEDLRVVPASRKEQEDTRLTIDIREADGGVTTYYASWFSLCSMDSSKKRPVDELFREKIRAYATHPSKNRTTGLPSVQHAQATLNEAERARLQLPAIH